MKKSIQNTIDNETPFKVIKFTKKAVSYEVRLYWTKNAGAYGYQVVTAVYKDHCLLFTDITSGCGYSKECQATEYVWRELGVYPRLNKYLHSEIDYRYHVGGNFYRIPSKDILKLKKRK